MLFIEIEQLVLFLSASLILIIIPGPDLIFLVTQSLHNGIKAGLATALGLAGGNLVHTLAAVLGITLVLQTIPHAFTAIKFFGACYLLYLAYECITNSNANSNKTIATYDNHVSFFIRGLLMNILNPKVALFFLAFLPQFIPEDALHPSFLMMALGCLFTILVIIIFSSIVILSYQFKQHILTNNLNSRFLNLLSATVFIALSLHLLTSNF